MSTGIRSGRRTGSGTTPRCEGPGARAECPLGRHAGHHRARQPGGRPEGCGPARTRGMLGTPLHLAGWCSQLLWGWERPEVVRLSASEGEVLGLPARRARAQSVGHLDRNVPRVAGMTHNTVDPATVTPEMAAQIRRWRCDEDYSWRAVARTAPRSCAAAADSGSGGRRLGVVCATVTISVRVLWSGTDERVWRVDGQLPGAAELLPQ